MDVRLLHFLPTHLNRVGKIGMMGVVIVLEEMSQQILMMETILSVSVITLVQLLQ